MTFFPLSDVINGKACFASETLHINGDRIASATNNDNINGLLVTERQISLCAKTVQD